MLRWILRLIGLAVLAFGGMFVYDSYRAGLFNLPDMPKGAYHLSFKGGLRAIILDADVPEDTFDDGPGFFRALSYANPERKYLGFALPVQSWFEDAWSWCAKPTDEEIQMLTTLPEDVQARYRNARFEATCKIEVDGKSIYRGLIFSVPRI